MKQSRLTSLFKSLVSTAVGFGVAFIANMLILPFFGLDISHSANLVLTTIYTVISIVRGYALERVFEALGWRQRISPFMAAVIAERQRQITDEGWSLDHDDTHARGELGMAGVSYVRERCIQTMRGESDRVIGSPPGGWPWSLDWWKPTDFRRDLVKGAALILAEGEKFDRSRSRRLPQMPSMEASLLGLCEYGPDKISRSTLAHGKTRSQHVGTSESIPPDHG